MHAAASVFLNVRARWRRMVSFTPRPLCFTENDLATHRMGEFWRREKFVAAVGTRTPARLEDECYL
jgi:hypothetical protein